MVSFFLGGSKVELGGTFFNPKLNPQLTHLLEVAQVTTALAIYLTLLQRALLLKA